ncbi:MAG: SLC13 family permease, partial [Desulfurococcus sp.]
MIKLVIYIAVIFTLSYLFTSMVHLTGPIGSKITEVVTEYRGAPVDLDSEYADLTQAITLTIFFTVIVVTIIKMEWRVAAAISGIGILVMSAIVPPQDLVVKAIDWRLLLFLIGSMTLAGILRETGVFNRLAVSLLSKSRSSLGLLMLLGIFSAVLSMILGEVTSIIYAIMVILELKRVMRIDLKPLIIFTVLATNTGSVALPIGNPIGIYIAFTANIAVSEFIVKCLTLSLLELMVLVLLFKLVLRDYTKALDQELERSRELISKLSVARTIDVSGIEVKHFKTSIFI